VTEHYDAVIVGAGPAGIFAALELGTRPGRSVLLVEKGRGIEKRHCPARETHCVGCTSCDITTGWGGAGAFSDGKLTLTGEVGGWLGEFVGHEALSALLADADRLWLKYGADVTVHGPDPSVAEELVQRASVAGMQLLPMHLRHIGTDRSPAVLQAMREHLEGMGVHIRMRTGVVSIRAQDGTVQGVELDDGTLVDADAVIVAPGREGAEWLSEQAEGLDIELSNNAVDIGVRVEVPAHIMEPVTTPLYEAKLIHYPPTFQDRVRTFCMNPYGEVTTELYGDIVTVNGHSYAADRTQYTNFAVLVSQTFTHPFREPITYGRSIAKLANLLGEGILVQRLGDLRSGRRSTQQRIASSSVRPTMPSATPGDLACVLPYRHLTDVLEFIGAMDAFVPGVASPDTLLYGVEVKFYSSRLDVDRNLMTRVNGLYAIGDGAGITRGLMQSSASGLVAARAVVRTWEAAANRRKPSGRGSQSVG